MFSVLSSPPYALWCAGDVRVNPCSSGCLTLYSHPPLLQIVLHNTSPLCNPPSRPPVPAHSPTDTVRVDTGVPSPTVTTCPSWRNHSVGLKEAELLNNQTHKPITSGSYIGWLECWHKAVATDQITGFVYKWGDQNAKRSTGRLFVVVLARGVYWPYLHGSIFLWPHFTT